jgi:hypothetical protein
MNKTLGQVAYEAYCETTDWKSLISGSELPKWKDVKPEIKHAWEQSAEAVKNAYGEYVKAALWDFIHKDQ